MKKVRLGRMLRGRALAFLGLALIVGLMVAPGAKVAAIDLLTAGPAYYAVLGLSTDIDMTSSTITGINPAFGNVGVVAPGELDATSSNTITGTVFLQNADQDDFSKFLTPGGGVVIDAAKLNQAKTDALARSAYYASLGTTPGTPNTINTNTTINASDLGGGLIILNLTGGLNFTNGEVLTLKGTAADAFVFNVPDNAKFKMTAISKILVSGGLLPQNVLFNLLEKDKDYDPLGSEIDGFIRLPTLNLKRAG